MNKLLARCEVVDSKTKESRIMFENWQKIFIAYASQNEIEWKTKDGCIWADVEGIEVQVSLDTVRLNSVSFYASTQGVKDTCEFIRQQWLAQHAKKLATALVSHDNQRIIFLIGDTAVDLANKPANWRVEFRPLSHAPLADLRKADCVAFTRVEHAPSEQELFMLTEKLKGLNIPVVFHSHALHSLSPRTVVKALNVGVKRWVSSEATFEHLKGPIQAILNLNC